MEKGEVMKTEYVNKLAENKIFNDGYVQLWDFSNANSCQEAREEACSLVASATRGADISKNPAKLYERLSKEAAEGKPGRVFEFLPILDGVANEEANPDDYNYYRFGYTDNGYNVNTNLRNLMVNYGLDITENKRDCIGFIAFKIKAPEFVWQQFATHEMMGRFISRVSESRRVTDIGDYWLPDRLTDDDFKWLKREFSFDEAINYLQNLGFKKEIYQRFPQGWEYRTFWLCGWLQDPYAWRNLLMERGALPDLWSKTWVQEQTKDFAQIMKSQIEKELPELFNDYLRK